MLLVFKIQLFSRESVAGIFICLFLMKWDWFSCTERWFRENIMGIQILTGKELFGIFGRDIHSVKN